MKIDRTRVTPEILTEMREVLMIAGVKYPQDLTEEQVISHIEHIFEILLEFAQKIRKVFASSSVDIVEIMNHRGEITEYHQQRLATEMVRGKKV